MPQKPASMKKSELLEEYQSLAIREANFRTIAEFSPVMLWMTDGTGKSQFFNRKWLKFIGLTGKTDPGGAWFDALHPDERKHCLDSFQSAFKAQLPFQMEYQLRRFDGEYRWILDTGEPHYDENGFAGYIGSSQDITERKLAEKTLRHSFAELNRHDREGGLLAEMSNCLQVCRSIDETYPVVSLYAKQLFAGHPGFIGVINNSRSLVETIVEWGDAHDSETVFNIEDCWSLRQGRPHWVKNPRQALNCWHIKQDASTGYLCLPMTAYGETRGIIHLQLPTQSSQETEQEKTFEIIKVLATTFANQVALALSNLKLREALQYQSVRDPLTHLYNRRYLVESMERELARAKRNQLFIGVIVIDIDHFKKYNDTFGHDAGDAVLRAFGELLKAQTRREDIPCRYGGEEFVMTLPGIDEENLLRRGESIRKSAKQLMIEHRDQKLGTITISLGLALFPMHGQTLEQLISAADTAMYQAKKQGRDQVVLAENHLIQ
ncbi:sensor domain-containing diguanylate cyclase [Methylomonas methanica]|uniref:diguanylate cyclase n=1 Tax=Methylomonas methanica (strain DSM 25384 / MC09) TaxID=857087 RepID=F9ZVX2_METMM|nr:GGDEF domain-containing protein [Methylomonas methanica]AEG00776.1 diguanylate cyclase with PAS/PAC sensor [Methylomonas methanica MC09]